VEKVKVDEKMLLRVLEGDSEKSEIDVYKKMDELDETQIVQEILGKSGVQPYIYSFISKEGRRVIGISWAGIKIIARKFAETHGELSITDLQYTDSGDRYCAIAKCTNLKTGVSFYGGAEQFKMMTLRSGKKELDKHALAKCIVKASRNAMRQFIPEELIENMISRYLQEQIKKKTNPQH